MPKYKAFKGSFEMEVGFPQCGYPYIIRNETILAVKPMVSTKPSAKASACGLNARSCSTHCIGTSVTCFVVKYLPSKGLGRAW